MATLLSDEFLRPHPATTLWWEQREQCLRCANVICRLEGDKEITQVMRCKAVRTAVGRKDHAYCIDARIGLCGPEATLFKEKK
jgi:hypothetical protein